jgi:hypothetical protein
MLKSLTCTGICLSLHAIPLSRTLTRSIAFTPCTPSPVCTQSTTPGKRSKKHHHPDALTWDGKHASSPLLYFLPHGQLSLWVHKRWVAARRALRKHLDPDALLYRIRWLNPAACCLAQRSSYFPCSLDVISLCGSASPVASPVGVKSDWSGRGLGGVRYECQKYSYSRSARSLQPSVRLFDIPLMLPLKLSGMHRH